MRIINATKNLALASDASIANTLLKRIKGLLGKKCLGSGQALILSPCNSIHTFFMQFSIDVLFIDHDNNVVGFKSCIRPFRATGIYWRAKAAIEFPPGTITNSSISIGDHIDLI